MRRLIQVLAFLVVILSGSLPGVRLLGTSQAERCCGVDACPCRMPARTPGPDAPCGVATTSPAAFLAAPCEAAQSHLPRTEPSPIPRTVLAQAATGMLLADPSVLARPGPTAPGPSPDWQPLLSVFRI